MLTPKDIIKQLKPCHYRYNDKLDLGDKVHYGFIAQDLVESFGDDYAFVMKEDKTGYYKVNYVEFISVLVSVVQQQQQEIEQLKRDITILKEK